MYNNILIEDSIEKFGCPLYIYNKDLIIENIKKVTCAFSGYNLLYSLKANPFVEILKVMLDNGVGIDAASKNEVSISNDLGFDNGSIYYSSPGKSKIDIEMAIDKSIIIADSLNEILLINNIAKDRDLIINIGVRLNISNPKLKLNHFEVMGGISSKFGIDVSLLLNQAFILKELSNINIVGIHVYFGSQFLNEDLILNNFKLIAETALIIKNIFKIAFINFGGGFGIPYQRSETELNIDGIGECIHKCENSKKLFDLGIKCNIELGRYLVGKSGIYVTKVVDIKDSFGERYVILSGGMNSFFRPIFTMQYHNIVQLTNEKNTEIVNLVGNTCTPLDTYYKGILLKKMNIGDIVIFENAGAYGFSMSLLDFISPDRPAQIFG